jgi:hypothetical protein
MSNAPLHVSYLVLHDVVKIGKELKMPGLFSVEKRPKKTFDSFFDSL